MLEENERRNTYMLDKMLFSTANELKSTRLWYAPISSEAEYIKQYYAVLLLLEVQPATHMNLPSRFRQVLQSQRRTIKD